MFPRILLINVVEWPFHRGCNLQEYKSGDALLLGYSYCKVCKEIAVLLDGINEHEVLSIALSSEVWPT